MRFLSIKLRVTLWFTFMMIIIVALVLTFMLIVSNRVVTNDAEKRLIQTMQADSDDIQFENDVLNFGGINFYQNGVYTLIYDTDKTLLAGAGRMAFEGDDQFENAITRTVKIDGGRYLVYDLFVQKPGGSVWLRGIISPESFSSVIRTLAIISIFVFPFLVVIAAVVGWLIARSAFKPVRQITDTVEAISDGSDLSARIGLKKGRDEIHRLAATFDSMFDRLETSFKAEKQFASDASHELRTPTAVILAECEYARQNGGTAEEYKETVEVVERQAKKMSLLINQLLSITRLDQGTQKASFETANLSELADVVCDELAVTDTRGIALTKTIAEGIFARIDVGLMTRLVQNLLENAYKYGKDGGNILVSLRAEGRNALLSVSDDGIGIAPEDISNIWRRFWQADSSRGNYTGNGLGLSMVRQIADIHGGTMSVQSEPGRGSTFTFTMPIR